MKTPRFEEMAARWRDKADFYIVFSREAHAGASGAARLGEAADELMRCDADGDNAVTLEEFDGPYQAFEPFDLDKDGVVRSHELLAARKIPQFAEIEAPTTMAERRALAQRFRDEVPGDIPVLLDELDDHTSKAYGGRPNSLFVIAADGTISHEFAWASERDAERALAELFGEAPPQFEAGPIDWAVVQAPLAKAQAGGRPLLVQFTAPGCGACAAMDAGTLADPAVDAALGAYERVVLSVEHDAAWALFEALELTATPSFVIVDPGSSEPRARSQGLAQVDAFIDFLSR